MTDHLRRNSSQKGQVCMAYSGYDGGLLPRHGTVRCRHKDPMSEQSPCPSVGHNTGAFHLSGTKSIPSLWAEKTDNAQSYELQLGAYSSLRTGEKPYWKAAAIGGP